MDNYSFDKLSYFLKVKAGGFHTKDLSMNNDLHKEILEKAFFVAGSNPWFRDEKDTLAISAVNDAENLLKTLPPNLAKPSINAGTTASPDEIISFTWRDFRGGTVRWGHISCKGNGLYDASWEGQRNREYWKSISLPELIALDIAQKIRSLKDSPSPAKPSIY